jgi:hypothetical protein
MDINMVFTLPTEFRGVEEFAQICLDPKEVVFKKPKKSSQHLKPLYIQGHIDRRPIYMMLIDDCATVNLMLYSIFKKLRREDDKLVKTILTLNDMGGNPMEIRDIVYMELTVGSKSQAAAFFIIKLQGNYSIIFRRDWIQANRCVPSTVKALRFFTVIL